MGNTYHQKHDRVDFGVVILPNPSRDFVPAKIERLELDLADGEFLVFVRGRSRG